MTFEQAFDEALHSACDLVNAYYSVICAEGASRQDSDDADECYYESIRILAPFFGMSENQFEDACTDTRERGWDYN